MTKEDFIPGEVYYFIEKSTNKYSRQWLLRFDSMIESTVYDSGAVSVKTETIYYDTSAFADLTRYSARLASPVEKAWFHMCLAFNEYTPIEEFKFNPNDTRL